jgi:hypothetical protein
VFARLFKLFAFIEVIEDSPADYGSEIGCKGNQPVDIIVLPLNREGKPDLEMLPHVVPQAKLLAVSPTGEVGMRRMPGESQWEEFRPFGLKQLIKEVSDP